MNEAIERQIGKFFLIGQLTNKIVLITISSILNKCSILKNTKCKGNFFSRCTKSHGQDQNFYY
jgi:hypothetical protein